MNEKWLPQSQVNNNVPPILGTIMLWYLKKEDIVWTVMVCAFFLFTQVTLNASFLQRLSFSGFWITCLMPDSTLTNMAEKISVCVREYSHQVLY